MKKFTKIMAIALTVIMVMSAMTGCSLFGPKDAADLLEKSQKAMSAESGYTIDMTANFDADLEMDMMGSAMDLDVPITLDAKMDVFNNKNIHGTLGMSGNVKATVEMDVNTPNPPLDTAKFSECYMQTDTPVYKNLCDVLEETFRSTTYSCQNYYPTNSRKEREFEANYSKFWNSRTNILLVKLAKATGWNISLLNNRRDKEIPDRANTAKLKKYYAGRTKANAVSQQEIDGLIAKFRTIIG